MTSGFGRDRDKPLRAICSSRRYTAAECMDSVISYEQKRGIRFSWTRKSQERPANGFPVSGAVLYDVLGLWRGGRRGCMNPSPRLAL